MVQPALDAAETLNATVINMRFVKPLDTSLIDDITSTHSLIVTIEENAIMGGAGSAVAEHLSATDNKTAIKLMGLPDKFIDHGEHKQQLSDCGLDADGIINTVNQHFQA
jgi:1-deoxy-D-xylulose-5-phosphate synthase